MLASPEIVPGWAGAVFTVTTRVRAMEVPQLLFATTEIVPPELPAVALIVFDALVPLQPEGKVQV